MIIALTGTPGTGKTTVCGFMQEHSQYRKQYCIIDLNSLVLDEKLYTDMDMRRNSYNADMEKLGKRVKDIINEIPQGIDIILEGHLSHLLPADAVIVLRTNPVALRKRLGKRMKYSYEKVKENANAEALDVILVEASQNSDRVYEINTTDATIQAVVKSIVTIIGSMKNGKIPEDFKPGKINWIDLVES